MFGLFKKKNPIEVMQKEYSQLLEDAHRLSKTDRTASDAKMAEANELLKKMESFSKDK